MNAQSKILGDPIGTFLPGCEGDERQVRSRLIRARDIATSRVSNMRSADARELYWMAIRAVTEWVYRPANLADLQDVANQCVRLFLCADFFERQEVGHG